MWSANVTIMLNAFHSMVACDVGHAAFRTTYGTRKYVYFATPCHAVVAMLAKAKVISLS